MGDCCDLCIRADGTDGNAICDTAELWVMPNETRGSRCSAVAVL